MKASERDAIEFVNRLGNGRKNAKHKKQLCIELGWAKDGRKLREAKEYALRNLGILVASTNDGYFIAETVGECQEALHRMESMSKSILFTMKVFRAKLDEVEGQTTLD